MLRILGLIFFIFALFLLGACKKPPLTQSTQKNDTLIIEKPAKKKPKRLILAAERFGKYLSILENKNVGLLVNPSSKIGNTHLVDTLLALGVKVKKVYAPEHGFRGKADAGENVDNEIDSKTGLPIISLYGNNKKPTPEQLADIDVLIFDIQDVGVRFFTYISTMHYAMEACAENNKKFIVLDRPNPNGDYVAGPVLQKGFESFIGMHPIPVVHGLTVGELALMINGEKWLKDSLICDLKVIRMKNYYHKKPYLLPVKPSPNLPNHQAVRLYPSLCFFEGTLMSVGRGTDFPFQVIGYPDSTMGNFQFQPRSIEGMSKYPLYEGKLCFGEDFRKVKNTTFSIGHLIDFYQKFRDKNKFFTNFFNKLAGNSVLQEQIKQGMTEDAIKATWQADLDTYKKIRKKYLLYD